MKQILFALAIVVCHSAIAGTPAWIALYATTNSSVYGDRNSLQIASDKTISFWRKDELKNRRGVKVPAKFLSHVIVRCGSAVVNIDNAVIYDAYNNLIASSIVARSRELQTGSEMSRVVERVCRTGTLGPSSK